MSEELVSIKIQLKYPDNALFQRRFAPYIGRYSMFLPTRNLKPRGTMVSFQFLLADKRVAFSGQGVVQTMHRPTPQSAGGLGVQYTALHQQSHQALYQILQQGIPTSPMVPQVHPVQVGVLSDHQSVIPASYTPAPQAQGFGRPQQPAHPMTPAQQQYAPAQAQPTPQAGHYAPSTLRYGGRANPTPPPSTAPFNPYAQQPSAPAPLQPAQAPIRPAASPVRPAQASIQPAAAPIRPAQAPIRPAPPLAQAQTPLAPVLPAAPEVNAPVSPSQILSAAPAPAVLPTATPQQTSQGTEGLRNFVRENAPEGPQPPSKPIQAEPSIESRAAQGQVIPEKELPLFYGAETELPDTGPIIGIDLGTTNSCCAIVEGNRPRVVPSRFGYNTIPSIVAYDERHNLLVGHPAKNQIMLNPQNTVYGSKRLIGRKFHSAIVQFIKNRFHYDIVSTNAGEAGVKIDHQPFSLQEVAALVLTEIREIAQSYLEQPIYRAVISVPAYYNDSQRQAVRRAGLLAGLRVIRIVNEPTAAALAYGFGRHLQQKILVYDLGGGTFDASVLQINHDIYEVISTGGNTFLGGVDFDNRLIDHVLERFQAEHGTDLRRDAVKMQRIKDAVEKAKCDLSMQPQTELHIPYIDIKNGIPLNIQMPLDRNTLNNLVGDLIDETLRVCDEVLRAQNLSPRDIDEVILVGGQTRMPLIHERITAHFNKGPHRNVHPDEAVALGTAVLAHSIGREDHLRLIDVLAMSIGIGLPGGRFKTIVPRNTTMPFSKSYMISTTQDNQTEMEIMIFQGESQRVSENAYLGTLEIDNIPKAPKGRMRFEINFNLDQEAILTVTATDLQTREKREVVLSTKDTPEDIQQKLGAPADEAPPPKSSKTNNQPESGGLIGWLKGMFRRK